MRKVYDYKDVRKLDESLLANEIAAGTVVTATASLASALTGYYRNYDVVDIHSFVSAIATKWEKGTKDVKNYIQLRNIISKYIKDNEIKDEKEATYLHRNAFDMWNAIKLLAEADVYPSDLPDLSEPVKHFKNIWDQFEKNNDCIYDLRASFDEFDRDSSLVQMKLNNYNFENVEKLSQNLYLIGFYFVTPIQERIFDALEKAGFVLNFLNCHDSNYPFATEIWTKTFEEAYVNNAVKDIQPDYALKNIFGELINGEKINENIKLVKHFSTFEFADMVKNAFDKEEQIFTPDPQGSEKILMEFFPEFYNKKHLLSYPVGQYVYYLHMLRDSFRNRLYFKFEYVKKCFATGWLVQDNLNGINYNYEIEILEPFFKGCYDVKTWLERFDQLIEAKKIVDVFDDREKGLEKWHQLLGNPFLNVGVFNIPNETIINIKILFNKLVDDFNELFPNDDATDLYDHFLRIRKLIESHSEKVDLLKGEKDAAEELIRQLSNEEIKGMKCPLSNVRDAITMLIGNQFDAYETLEEETSNKQTITSSLTLVESAMMSNYGQNIHLVLADEFSLPGIVKNLPWPLTSELLDDIDISNNENAQRYVKAMRSVIDNRPLSYRYLFFSFMGVLNDDNKPEITIEWICKKENKDIDMSSYIKMFGLIPLDNDVNFDDSIMEVIEATNSYNSISEFELNEHLPDVAKMDYMLCKNRYLYSYALNKLPYYASEFHYGFLLSKLITSFSSISDGLDKDDIKQRLEKVFPFFRKIEMRQSEDFASEKVGKPERIILDEYNYSANYYLTHYLNDDVYVNAENKFNQINSDLNDLKVTEDECKYCPYCNICMKRYKEELKND